MGAKKRAMQCFASQQSVQDYARHIEGLNTFRTYTLEARITHAEAYRWLAAADVEAQAHELLEQTQGRNADLLTKAEADFEKMQAHWLGQRAAWEQETQRLVDEKNAEVLAWTHRLDQLAEQAQQEALRHQDETLQLKSSVNALTASLTSLQAIHQTMLNSRSWRWTQPLRWLSSLLRASDHD